MTPCRLIALAVSAFVAFPAASYATPSPVTAEQAQAIAEKMAQNIMGFAPSDSTLEIQGKVDVSPDKDGYAFSIPAIRGASPLATGGVVMVGPLKGRLIPTDQPNVYGFSAQVGEPALKFLDAAGDVSAEVHVKAQTILGNWDISQPLSYTAALDLKEVSFLVPDPMASSAATETPASAPVAPMTESIKIAGAKLSFIRTPQAADAAKADGKVDVQLTGIVSRAPQEKDTYSLQQASFSFDYQGYDSSVYDKTMAAWNGQVPLDFTTQLAQKISAATDGKGKGNFQVRGFKAELYSPDDPAPEIWTMAQASGAVSAAVKNNLVDGQINIQHTGFAVPDTAPIAQEVLPKTGELALSFSALQFDALLQSVFDMKEGIPTAKTKKTAQVPDGVVPQIKIDHFNLNARSLSAMASGLIKVDKSATLGMLADISASLDGIDTAVARTTTYAKTEQGQADALAQMLIIGLSTANMMGQSQPNSTVKKFDIAIDPSGAVLLNGSPLASFAQPVTPSGPSSSATHMP